MQGRIIVATGTGAEEFHRHKATGRTALRGLPPGCDLLVYPDNEAGLPRVYNDAIEKSKHYDFLVFCHDDVHFLDHFWIDRCREGLAHFDILGVAGARDTSPSQVGWCFTDQLGVLIDPARLAGTIAHGKAWPPDSVDRFGPSRVPVDLIDGVFIACRTGALLRHGLRFDERFDFHFYDLDFSNAARAAGLSIGVWDIALMHESTGGFGSLGWQANHARYAAKWCPAPKTAPRGLIPG